MCADDLDTAEVVVTRMRDEGRRRGSVLSSVCALMSDVEVLVRRGDLRAVEAQFAGCAELVMEHQLLFGLPSLIGHGVEALLERPALASLRGLAELPQLEQFFDLTAAGALVFEGRGALRLADGRSPEGIADLRHAGELLVGMGLTHPGSSRWRSRLALALAGPDRDEALGLATVELDAARTSGMVRAVGVALHAAGLVEGGADGLALLEESVAVLHEFGRAPLEEARSQTDLGAALRRAGRRAAGREPLRAGLALAERCGAVRLAGRAEEELRATGAKPRRRATDGVDALTPSEARVARLAADGWTTREIAEALFVTAKTVENQLGAVYRKLGVARRSQLAEAMSGQR
jgi:DNA-binding NarL/FixJ family response regulator